MVVKMQLKIAASKIELYNNNNNNNMLSSGQNGCGCNICGFQCASGCGGICVLCVSDFNTYKSYYIDVVAFFHLSRAVCLYWKLVFYEM